MKSNNSKSLYKNPSISARVKRRNKQGFCGQGNHNPNPQVVQYNINDTTLNHKLEDKDQEHLSLVRHARRWCRHPGSKTLKQLKRYH